jgi:sugar phosphate isomerase/epimerase
MKRCDLLADGSSPLSYCTNVHPARGLAEAERVYRQISAPLLRRCLGEGDLLLAAWWSQDLVRSFVEDTASLHAHADLCEELGLRPFSLNLFPMGRFHGGDAQKAVKEAVYQPDWASEERLAYTIDAARSLATICARFSTPSGVMSTLPLGFRGRDRAASPTSAHSQNILRVAQVLAQIESETGVHLELALEPEPWCLLESVSETLCWLDDELAALAARHDSEPLARRHIGLCLDLCHAAVMGEDAVQAHQTIERRGWRVSKVQLSSCLRARGPEGLARLLAYDEPVYLHQCRLASPIAQHFLDLSDPTLAELSLAPEDLVYSHFHVPLLDAGSEPLTTTQDLLLPYLAFVRSGALRPGTPLEVETYTNPAIEEDLRFAVAELLREG